MSVALCVLDLSNLRGRKPDNEHNLLDVKDDDQIMVVMLEGHDNDHDKYEDIQPKPSDDLAWDEV